VTLKWAGHVECIRETGINFGVNRSKMTIRDAINENKFLLHSNVKLEVEYLSLTLIRRFSKKLASFICS
jgi:hypothetical protein